AFVTDFAGFAVFAAFFNRLAAGFTSFLVSFFACLTTFFAVLRSLRLRSFALAPVPWGFSPRSAVEERPDSGSVSSVQAGGAIPARPGPSVSSTMELAQRCRAFPARSFQLQT